MTEVKDISALAKQFKSAAELTAYCNSQFQTISKQQEIIKKLEDEIKHLQQLLLVGGDDIDKVIVTPEEALVDSQILLMSQANLGKELSLEEVKKLDLLIKNKNLLRGKSTSIVGESRKIDKSKISDAELIAAASIPVKK